VALGNARKTNDIYQTAIDQLPDLQKQLTSYQQEGQPDVPQEDQAVQFFRIIQNQASQSGVLIVSMGSTRQLSNTNSPFFVEQNQTITVQSGEKQLVDFLYALGAEVEDLRCAVGQVHDPARNNWTAVIDPDHAHFISHAVAVSSR
jgi:hypothetical protein